MATMTYRNSRLIARVPVRTEREQVVYANSTIIPALHFDSSKVEEIVQIATEAKKLLTAPLNTEPIHTDAILTARFSV